MAYQTTVPVKIPPSETTKLASDIEKVLPGAWLVAAYDIPVVGDGVAVFGPIHGPMGRKNYADITIHPDIVLVKKIKCSTSELEQIVTAVGKSITDRQIVSA